MNEPMTTIRRSLAQSIERSLAHSLALASGHGGPPGLLAAMRYAVFPAGARLRPRLALTVACACGDDNRALADAAASAIELLHCASLVHDDLPCFDNAPTRRGKPSVHAAFGERLAVLSGDALIVLAFQVLAHAGALSPHRLASLVSIVARAVGAPTGIAAGQAWECEPSVQLREYQRQKTGALFAAATMAGAAAAGAAPDGWRILGDRLGEAYQVADDIRDLIANPDELGKPVGRDAALGRPNAAEQLGMDGARRRLDLLLGEAIDSIPADCPGAAGLRDLILAEARQSYVPKELAQVAA
jgi:geranylgeranyl diphosphate synthase type II